MTRTPSLFPRPLAAHRSFRRPLLPRIMAPGRVFQSSAAFVFLHENRCRAPPHFQRLTNPFQFIAALPNLSRVPFPNLDSPSRGRGDFTLVRIKIMPPSPRPQQQMFFARILNRYRIGCHLPRTLCLHYNKNLFLYVILWFFQNLLNFIFAGVVAFRHFVKSQTPLLFFHVK